MQTCYSIFFVLGLAVAGIVGCHSERVTSSPSAVRVHEVVRLRATNPTKAPVLFGWVQAVDEAGRYPLIKALVAVDGQAYYTSETGAFRIPVAPGNHQVRTEYTGMRPARTTVKVERGDSVQVNFYLRFAD